MTVLNRTNLMGFRLAADRAEDDRLAALLDAKIGTKGDDDSASDFSDDDDDDLV
jgi:hypothetical protein